MTSAAIKKISWSKGMRSRPIEPLMDWESCRPTLRDAALRLTYLLRDSKRVQLAARERWVGEKRHFVYFAEDNGKKIQIATFALIAEKNMYKLLAEHAVPASISKDAPRTLEFRVVGNKLTMKLNDSVILTAEDDSRPDGLFHFAALKGVLIQKIEVQPLDDPADGGLNS